MTSSTRLRNAALQQWYDGRARELPWRGHTDPYPILVSEVMLQQTQVNRVVPKFEAFLDRFPTVESLAGADLGSVLELWHGLGYNSRARRLRDAAQVVADQGWPTDAAGLEELPGVGPYTAAAVASIAYGHQVPAIDTNLRRVLSRWRGTPLAGSELRHAASAELGEAPAGDWNQAVMDLGATLCRPRSPACAECPVRSWCADPTVYVPPPRQSRFEGSMRQIRARVLRELAGGPMTVGDLVEIDLRAGDAVAALERDGMVVTSGNEVSLAP